MTATLVDWKFGIRTHRMIQTCDSKNNGDFKAGCSVYPRVYTTPMVTLEIWARVPLEVWTRVTLVYTLVHT